ncbi:MAG TPA: MFS transporter [Propionicimonas sp.]|nr:MFS transporter [Propionicimonas sp.]
MRNQPPTDVGFRSARGAILMALMLATGLIAVDATILATAVPSVVADLGQFDQYPWLFSVYLLAQAVSVPLYSKLADTIGRKPVILVGVALFGLGSVLAMLAWSMPSLIAFRAVQGLGAGAITPMTMTIVGDLYSVAERAVVQGYIASVWAVSSVVGPALGGVFAQFGSWRWIFAVNIPLVLVAGWALLRKYDEQVESRRHHIDFLGAGVLTVGLTAVILALLEGGSAWEWTSPASFLSFGVGILALAVFPFVERRAVEPVLDLAILRRRLIWATTTVSLGVGALLIGVTSFVPTFLERTTGAVPLISGIAVAALTLGWPLAAALAGRVYLRVGFRRTTVLGSAIATLGSIGLAAASLWPQAWTVAVACFVIGFGLGWTAAPSLIAAQSSVGWNERGLVTGTNMLARSVGSAVGVAIFGAIANNLIAAGGGETHIPGVTVAFSGVFVAAAISAVLMLLAALRMPPGGVDSEAYAAADTTAS